MESSSLLDPSEKQIVWHCTHCRSEIPLKNYARLQTDDDVVFCCQGCQWVYQILSKHHLDQYYKIKNKSNFFSPANPVSPKTGHFQYLDDESSRNQYAYGEKNNQMNFYIEGVHCVACLWLMERLSTLVKDVESSELDLGTTILKVTLHLGASFSAVAETLDQLGYKPHPLEKDEQGENLRSAEDKKQLLEIGISGFCAANIMFLFIAMYAGLSGTLLEVFRWASFGLFLPVVTYCSKPFYKSAVVALKTKQMNIDVPVTAALILGSMAGVYHLMIQAPHIYFDSLSIFVFLLLSTRFFLKKLHQKVSGKTDFSEFLIPKFVFRLIDGVEDLKRTPVEQLCEGDKIRIAANDTIAVDGIVWQGESHIDCHMLNGESMPVGVKQGAEVFAGTVNQGHPLIIKVTKTGSETRLAKILENINQAEKPHLVQMADRVAKWYLYVIFSLSAAVLFAFMGSDFSEGFNRALSLIIVACPCALALATPLAYTMGLRSAMSQGVLLKGPTILERLALVKELFIDKTGTLTYGQYDVLDWKILEGRESFYDLAYALEKNSQHPVALAIKRYVLNQKFSISEKVFSAAREEIGMGVSGKFEGHFYEIKAPLENHEHPLSGHQIHTFVNLYQNGLAKVCIRLGDRLRESSIETLAALKKDFHKITLLSGDHHSTVEFVAKQLMLDHYASGVAPESKQAIVQKTSRAMMIGDGANDALALSSAFVSAAVQGSLDVSFRCSDVYFLKPGIAALPRLLKTAKQTRSVIYRNLVISLIYNVAGVVLALSGWVTPLVAAVIMPISSLSVLISSFLGFRGRK